ncbi:hypothetical protein MNBD_ALPHA04-1081 [hydrothermal vent metagenome]|uniref:Nudix hydrolase domain-containing protein n=1 Tax=hydrothermal vent metagenome TaxID=652676 RepID=A0A3B0S863_9ZZZZ
MLVRVRDNDLWYLLGGTIEENETAVETLLREIKEELNVELDPQTVDFDRRIVGPALGRDGDVELNCFHGRWFGEVQAKAEVSEVSFIDYASKEIMAPAVKTLVGQLQQEQIC